MKEIGFFLVSRAEKIKIVLNDEFGESIGNEKPIIII
jgi:hypothetical protein